MIDIALRIDDDEMLNSVSESIIIKCFISRLYMYEHITTDC